MDRALLLRLYDDHSGVVDSSKARREGKAAAKLIGMEVDGDDGSDEEEIVGEEEEEEMKIQKANSWETGDENKDV